MGIVPIPVDGGKKITLLRMREQIWDEWQELRGKILAEEKKNATNKKKRESAVDVEEEAAKQQPPKQRPKRPRSGA